MRLSVLINEGPYQHQAADTAYHYVKAALEMGYEVYRVFFYHDGVYNGSDLISPPQDERHITHRWSHLASEHHVDLVVCIAAAQRRGLLDDAEKTRLHKSASNLAAGFRLSGIGQLIEAAIHSDRLVTFGD